jgi:hypothetical protein
MRSGHIYNANARLVLDVLDVVWKTRWVGLGGGYFWGPNFSGWSLGVDVRMNF